MDCGCRSVNLVPYAVRSRGRSAKGEGLVKGDKRIGVDAGKIDPVAAVNKIGDAVGSRRQRIEVEDVVSRSARQDIVAAETISVRHCRYVIARGSSQQQMIAQSHAIGIEGLDEDALGDGDRIVRADSAG